MPTSMVDIEQLKKNPRCLFIVSHNLNRCVTSHINMCMYVLSLCYYVTAYTGGKAAKHHHNNAGIVRGILTITSLYPLGKVLFRLSPSFPILVDNGHIIKVINGFPGILSCIITSPFH